LNSAAGFDSEAQRGQREPSKGIPLTPDSLSSAAKLFPSEFRLDSQEKRPSTPSIMSLRHELKQVIPLLLAAVEDGHLDEFHASFLDVTTRLAAAVSAGMASREDMQLDEAVALSVEAIAGSFMRVDDSEENARCSFQQSLENPPGQSFPLLFQSTRTDISHCLVQDLLDTHHPSFRPPPNPKITNPKSASAEHPQNFRHLRDWFLSHLAHPFPTAAEKKALAVEKGLTTNSVNLWSVFFPNRDCFPSLLPPFRSC
jgi:hypothetical protein